MASTVSIGRRNLVVFGVILDMIKRVIKGNVLLKLMNLQFVARKLKVSIQQI